MPKHTVGGQSNLINALTYDAKILPRILLNRTYFNQSRGYTQLLSYFTKPTLDLSPSPHQVFHVLLIRPTKYDNDGYPIQWYKSMLPSNSLACMYGIALDAAERKVLGKDIEIRIAAFNEADSVVDYQRIIKDCVRAGHKIFLCLAGVQTNQFPRAIDIARHFTRAALPVCMGGFHVSGIVSMFDELTPELIEAQRSGISLFAGEAEMGRFDRVLQDAWNSSLPPMYNYIKEMVDLEFQPYPAMVGTTEDNSGFRVATVDLGRGCPYQCSFCCIINVQGNKSRFRTLEDFEAQVRQNWKNGARVLFITDDNFARNQHWEGYLDKLIKLREQGIKMHLSLQVDTLCHKVPRFIEKAAMAGALHVFIGIESINPDNLSAMKKYQNKITEYRKMLLEWKKHPVIIMGAMIFGLPNDTRESILRDIEIVKRELPIDILVPTIYTPLPGSEDHKNMTEHGIWMDPDLNKYDLSYRVVHHPLMSDEELDGVYQDVWNHFYSYDHAITIFRRMFALGNNRKKLMLQMLLLGSYLRALGIYSYDIGLLRRSSRLDRRSGYPIESFLSYHLWRISKGAKALATLMYWNFRLKRKMMSIFRDPHKEAYRDIAITPPSFEELKELDLFNATRGGKEAVQKVEFRRGTLRGKGSAKSESKA